MSLTLTVDMDRALVEGKLGHRLALLIPKLAGRKGYIRNGTVYSFDNSQANIDHFLKIYPEADFVDNRQLQKMASFGQGLINFSRKPRPEFKQVKPDYAHQKRAHEKIDKMKVCALFMGTGTGKTKVALDKGVKHYCQSEIDAILILTLKGVHEQWVEEQVPTHVHPDIPYVTHVWKGMKTQMEKRAFEKFLKSDKLQILTINIDAVKGDKAWNLLRRFASKHQGRILMAIDESQEIANHTSARSEEVCKFGEMLDYKMIMSGTPIPKNLVSEWSQFLFLDPNIIGHKYVTAFRKEYCDMGGFQNTKVVAHRNVERFHELTSPYIFRVTKEEELDLPPKVYTREVFQMHPDQQRHYDEIKATAISKMDGGEVMSVKNAATMILRLQQITNGLFVDDYGEAHDLPNPRLELLKKLDQRIEGKKIVWATYTRDVNLIKGIFSNRCVTYTGQTSPADRTYAKQAFMAPDSGVDIFISNPAAGGTGLNLQGECATAIYYNNSFNAVHRWQSEDRIHRIGTYKTITYIDLLAMKSVDYRILRNLKAKKDFQEYVLDDLRKMVQDETAYTFDDFFG